MKKEILFRRVISFGKFAYYGNRKINEITIEIEVRIIESAINYETLETVFNVPELSICGNVWNNLHTDIVSGGQNIDDIAEIVKTKRVKRIQEIWEQYHLNDLKAGTKKQLETLAKMPEYYRHPIVEKYNSRYDQQCDYLADKYLLFDGPAYNPNGFKYGSGWLYMPIPDEIIEELKTI